MPKDKKSKEGKKKEGTSQEVEVVVKRKSSIVDSSGGSSSSSSASSDNSGTSSEHGSQAGDSDGSLGGFVSDNEKGTMTNDSEEGTSSSVAGTSSSVTIQPFQIEIRDRTEEMQSLIHTGQRGQEVKLVTDQNNVPISESTHFRPIGSKDEPTTSAASQGTTNGYKQNGKPVVKGGCKQKQLTKKQRKEQERREKESSGAPTTYPGQREPQKKLPSQCLYNNENLLQMHHFDESASCDGVPDGEALVRGTNAAAQALLNSTNEVAIPFLRNEEELGKPMEFVDLHKNAQMRYLRFTTPLGSYMSLPPTIKLLHRMGYGIAASGIPDKVPLTLSINGAKHFMKHQYSDYVADGTKIVNWRSDFISQADMDSRTKAAEFKDWQVQLTGFMNEHINTRPDLWQKKTLCVIRDMDLRQVLLRFGEIERYLARNEAKCDKRSTELDKVTFAKRERPDRMKFLVTSMLEWGSQFFHEKCDDIAEKRCFSILMHLASTGVDEKPCYEQRHRKCTILHYFLKQCDDKKDYWLRQKFCGGHTILHFAAMTGSPCQIDVLLRLGAPLNELNDFYKSPVALATRRHQTLIARQLMWHGADIGGSLSLKHITPRTNRDAMYKEWGDYEDSIASKTSYKARDFIIARLKSLSMTFCSWLEAILLDSDARLSLSLGSPKSSLHQVRIGPDVFDVEKKVAGKLYKMKKLHMTIESSPLREPTVLFLIPCQYTRFDTTMGASNPHIVRTSMLTDALAVSQRIAEKEKKRVAAGDNRVEYTDDVKGCRPVRVLGKPISIAFGDGCSERHEVLESFCSYEHNGVYYAYSLPRSVSHSSSDSTNITVTLTIPDIESQRYKDIFFMVQAIQVVNIAIPKPLADSEPLTVSSFGKSDQEREEDIAARVAKRKAEILASGEDKQKEMDINSRPSTASSTRTTASTSATVSAATKVNGVSKNKTKTE